MESVHLTSTSQGFGTNKKRKKDNKGKQIAVSGTSKKNVQNKQDKEITCFFCKKVGHMKNTCTKYVASREKKGTLLNFSFEILEHIQWLRLLMNQIKIAIAQVIVNENDKILLSIPRRGRKWTTNVCMYQFQDVVAPIGILFPHICLFTLNALYTDLKVWEIKWIKNFFWHKPLNLLIWNMTQTLVP